MSTEYTYFSNLSELVDTVPSESIVSRTIHRGDGVKTMLFAFAPGQELSEHTASVPAIIQILEGDCDLTLGPDSFRAGSGSWAYMQPNLAHSLTAITPVRMLLIMLG
jgi:quercetin dioxygenase-like cupin family protein